MAMEGLAPKIIVVALGAGALGGADVLRVLLDFAGQSPLLDIAICTLVIAMLTGHLLGAMLLARFIRKPRAQAGAPGALATDCFAKMTLMLSLGIALLVFTACLVAVSGGLAWARFMVDVARKSPVIAFLVFDAAGSLPCIMPLLRAFREAGDADGAAQATRVPERLAMAFRTVYYFIGLPVAACILPSVAPGGHNGLRHFPGINSMFVGDATLAVVGIPLLMRISRCAGNAAGAGVATAPAAATDVGRFSKLTSLAVVSFALTCLLVATYTQPQRVPEGAMYPCSA